ncbi:hypothetical protein SUGI_0098880 [Cryptomeria japonica]|nr:hypothetical protein SUGI_0098880 [Cryptomeria japonica]
MEEPFPPHRTALELCSREARVGRGVRLLSSPSRSNLTESHMIVWDDEILRRELNQSWWIPIMNSVKGSGVCIKLRRTVKCKNGSGLLADPESASLHTSMLLCLTRMKP